MEKRYYLIEVEGEVEVFTEEPFERKKERDQMTKLIRATQEEDDSLFWADVDERGTLTVGSYKAGFFLEVLPAWQYDWKQVFRIPWIP